MTIADNIRSVRQDLPREVELVCVSKFHPEEAILEAYRVGERDFGENHVQEMVRKHEALPPDIRWHMLGHLQTNKVRQIVPFVYLIHSVDSLHLMQTIEREATRIDRTISVLLEVHVAREETKSGMTPDELDQLLRSGVLATMPHIRVRGIMGMATQTDDEQEVRRCFRALHELYLNYRSYWPEEEHPILSMGMSHDRSLALQEGSNMVRIGTAIFGERNY